MSILPYDSRILSFGSLEENAIFLLRRNKTEVVKRMIIFGAEKYVFLRRKIIAVREQEENILRRKNIFSQR